jgi:hypothetical protein
VCVCAHVSGEHVEGHDMLVCILREDDGRVLLGGLSDLRRGGVPGARRRLALLGGVHLLDAPALAPLELLPLGVRDLDGVRHAARQRPLERRALRVPRERRLQICHAGR